MVKRRASSAAHRQEYHPRYSSSHGNAGRCNHLRPRFQQGFLRVVCRRKGRPVAPRKKRVGGDGLEHAIFPARAAQGAGLFVDGRFHQQLWRPTISPSPDPNDLLCTAWKWQRGDVSRHTGGDLRSRVLGRDQGKDLCHADVFRHVLPRRPDCQAGVAANSRCGDSGRSRRSMVILRYSVLIPNAIGQVDKHSQRSCSRQKPSRKETPAAAPNGPRAVKPVPGVSQWNGGYCARSLSKGPLVGALSAQLRRPGPAVRCVR